MFPNFKMHQKSVISVWAVLRPEPEVSVANWLQKEETLTPIRQTGVVPRLTRDDR